MVVCERIMKTQFSAMGRGGLGLLNVCRRSKHWGSLFAFLLLGACNNDDDNSSEQAAAAVQACLEMADAVGDAAERACAQDYQANYDAFIQSAAAGSCDNVKQLRDEETLRSICLPWFSTATCAQLTDTTQMPAEYASQLLR